MIEKFRTEINKESKENFGNTRRLTVESPFRIEDEDSSHDVDRRLTDLESLIRRLQNEIDDMSNDSGGSSTNDRTRKSSQSIHDNKPRDDKKDSQIYHLNVEDMAKTYGHCNNLCDKKSEECSSNAQLYETFAAIRRNFSLLWDDGKEFDDKVLVKKEDKF
ncbi:unnamed protein product [Euphydryas editha]|uniref:Uncharacterized protein n=1 Tax=Euphydryas editha TaxID=104508 RepID=A0AAU9UIR6_EUPED|nr:unnamed protein product [Euphydryas editha]